MSYGEIPPSEGPPLSEHRPWRAFRGVPLAPRWKRWSAGAIDYFGIPWIGFFFARLTHHLPIDGEVLVVLANAAVLQGFEGQSAGKRLLNIRLISSYRTQDYKTLAGYPGVPICLWRQVWHIWDTVIVGIGWLRQLWDPRGQTGADERCGTICIADPPPFQLTRKPFRSRRLKGQEI